MIALGDVVRCIDAAGTDSAPLPPLVEGATYSVVWSGIADDINAPAINVAGANSPTHAYRADRFEVVA